MRGAWFLFGLGFGPWMRARVRVHVAGPPSPIPSEGRVLLCANHDSWWDGFSLRELQRRLRPRGAFRAVVLERELERVPLLRALGGIGIEPGSFRSGRKLLRSLRATPRDAVVALFPQGRLRPADPRPPVFETGVTRIAKALEPVTILPVGLRLVPGRTHRQEAYVFVGAPLAITGPESLAVRLERSVARQLERIEEHLDRHGELAADRWPPTGPRPLSAGAALLPPPPAPAATAGPISRA